jgi:hypothetical protein
MYISFCHRFLSFLFFFCSRISSVKQKTQRCTYSVPHPGCRRCTPEQEHAAYIQVRAPTTVGGMPARAAAERAAGVCDALLASRDTQNCFESTHWQCEHVNFMYGPAWTCQRCEKHQTLAVSSSFYNMQIP